MPKSLYFLLAVGLSLQACQLNDSAKSQEKSELLQDKNIPAAQAPPSADPSHIKAASAEVILARPQVPILCYHQVRNWIATDGKVGKDYIIEKENFKSHIKMLADSGYNTILPDQLYAYLNEGRPLPAKPIMLTFDDTALDHFTTVKPILDEYHYKAVFFIMTVSIGKKGRINYMDKAQIKQLADEGHVIGSHTYDHKNFKKYEGKDWEEQLDKPRKTLETIVGKPIDYFAYPFGLWNPEGFPELKKRSFKMAFALADKRDQQDPLLTIRRIIASGYWSANTLNNSIKKSF